MTEKRGAAWELGSDFDWCSAESALAKVPQRLPWMRDSEQVTYLESGRQALALLSAHLRELGYARLLMPDHFCDSMVSAFQSDNWTIDFFAVDEDWHCVPPAHLATPEDTLIFSMSYFGVPESQSWLDFLSRARHAGAVVVSDESHRVLDAGPNIADYRIASLRKLLPVPDGAFLVGFERDLPAPGHQAAARLNAMREKSAHLRGQRPGRHLEMFHAAEEMTERDILPARMSTASHELIDLFDYRRLRERRRRNHDVLSSGLEGSGFRVNTDVAQVPSHLVLSGLRTQQLRKHLIRHRIYCPVHWPAPQGRPCPAGDWRTNILSIPVDHRYAEDDMLRVCAAVHEFTSEGQE